MAAIRFEFDVRASPTTGEPLRMVRLVVVHKHNGLAFWMIGQVVGPGDSGQQTSEANVVALMTCTV